MFSEKSRENRVRRTLRRDGYVLRKMPARSWMRQHYDPGYMVVDDRNTVVLGACQREYEASIEEVEEWLKAP